MTSGGKGLGHATVRCLLRAGFDVAFTYGKSRKQAEELVAEAESLGRRAMMIETDLFSRAETVVAVHKAIQVFDRIDALVHNFGPFVFERIPLSDYSDESWQKLLDGNLSNFLWIYREVLPGMRSRGFGRIVTIGFAGAKDAVGWRYRAPYAAIKAGLASLTQSIAREERQNGITANMVCPGDIRGANKSKLIEEVFESDNPLARPPVGEDVARVIAFLCADESAQINGTITEVTGGYDILAYDDGTDVVTETIQYNEGDKVWVVPWQKTAHIEEVIKIPNRLTTYKLKSAEGMSGQFTAYQLQPV
ncbi:SDR family oxidoreductase [Alicyclobacillus tolerans]|uniref:3-oxoacyl-[acyl-carrier protein] reductase n=1 Tax=Alicyclobacillus tolerans TaxID=90970 RepID=A0A1M6K410_9BACL|nr:SDR family oxidoreductase [Alicyclobacillus montanus]SHJ53711.1 3-oxoacyl-[acyl-carrier protein] reductase [Alicyclobacillus montanus]